MRNEFIDSESDYKVCTHCGKKFYLGYTTLEDYVYKKFRNGKNHYFCSYSCMRAEEENFKTEEEVADDMKLLKKYNKAVNLKEANFLEDFQAWYEVEHNIMLRPRIRARKDFVGFVDRNRREIDRYLKECEEVR